MIARNIERPVEGAKSLRMAPHLETFSSHVVQGSADGPAGQAASQIRPESSVLSFTTDDRSSRLLTALVRAKSSALDSLSSSSEYRPALCPTSERPALLVESGEETWTVWHGSGALDVATGAS